MDYCQHLFNSEIDGFLIVVKVVWKLLESGGLVPRFSIRTLNWRLDASPGLRPFILFELLPCSGCERFDDQV